MSSFNYVDLAIEMSAQVKNVVAEDVKYELDYITETVYSAVIFAGEKVCNNEKYSDDEKRFVSQLVCEWAFHKVNDLIRAKIKKEYHIEILRKMAETILETFEICVINNIKQKIILQEVEKKVVDIYNLAIEKLFNDDLIDEEQLKKAYNQSNIDKMVNEHKLKEKKKIKYVKTYKLKNEKDESSIVTKHGVKINKKAQKFIQKAHIDYYLNNVIIIAIAMYGTVYIYSKLNNIELPISSTVFSILKLPSFFIPLFIAIGVKDVIKYIFGGLSKNEKEYLKEVEEANPSTKGLNKFINPKTIKDRLKTIMFIFTMFGVAIFFLIISILKKMMLIIPIMLVYYYASYKNSIPVGNFQDIILNKDFIIFSLVVIVTYLFIKNKKKNSQAENSQLETKSNVLQDYFPDETKEQETSYEELSEFVNEMGEEISFDYKQFANKIAEDTSKITPDDIPVNIKNKILKRVIDYALLSGEALENASDSFLTSQKMFIIKSVSKWTFYKSIDITRAEIEEDLHENILQSIAFYVYEIAKQACLKSIPQEKAIQAIEIHVNKQFIKEIEKLYTHKQISYEAYLKVCNDVLVD